MSALPTCGGPAETAYADVLSAIATFRYHLDGGDCADIETAVAMLSRAEDWLRGRRVAMLRGHVPDEPDSHVAGEDLGLAIGAVCGAKITVTVWLWHGEKRFQMAIDELTERAVPYIKRHTIYKDLPAGT